MAKKFNGKISIDVRDSVPDWEPFMPPRAPKGAPNVLYIVWDDIGFGALDTYGGLIDLPNMRRLVEKGLRYTQFHTTALCSPTRSCLLTGRNATSNSMACITEAATGYPGSSGYIPFENGFLSEVLVEHGYNTYAVGKWHLTPNEQMNMAAEKSRWPLGRGFERFYGFLGAETDQYYPTLIYDNHPIDPPATPEEGYHLSADLADQAISFIRDARAVDPDKPWLMYFCPGAGHAPHQVFKEWADKYKGKFDMGYEKYRELVLENQKKLGLVPKNTKLPSLNPYADVRSSTGQPWTEDDAVRPWESLSKDEKALFCRMAEVYAGFLSYTDHQLGRLLDFLEETKQLDNTLVVAVSDNGASGEGGPSGGVNENLYFNGMVDRIEDNLKHLDDLGSPATYNHYPTGWALAFNTPFKQFKRYANYQGGTSDFLIVSWPAGIKAQGELRDQYTHAIDIVPTIYECLGITPPDTVKGYTQAPIEGVSFKHTFDDAKAPTAKNAQFYTMLGTRGIWYQGWQANTIHPPTPSGWGHFEADRWELFHLDEDRSQMNDLAEKHPEKLELLKSLWFAQAGLFKGLPLDDRSALELLGDKKPDVVPERDHYVYYPDSSEVDRGAAVRLRGRSFNILTELTLDSAKAEGVLFAFGGRFGGVTLFLKDGQLHFVYNWLGKIEQKLSSTKGLPAGRCVLGVRFRLDSKDPTKPEGMAALYLNEEKVAEERIKVQPGDFSLAGEGLNVGCDRGQAVSTDYRSPFPFAGGTIHKVVVDVTGDRYRDAKLEFEAAMRRD